MQELSKEPKGAKKRNWNRRRKSVSHRIIRSLLAVLIPSFVILMIVSGIIATQSISALNDKLLQTQADYAVAMVDDFFGNKVKVAGMFQKSGDLQDYFASVNTREDIDAYESKQNVLLELSGALEEMKEEHVIQAWVADAKTDCYLLANGEVVEAGLADAQWYQMVQEEKKAVVSEPYQDPISGEEVVSAVSPVFSRDGTEIAGFMGFDVYSDDMTKRLAEIKVGQQGYMELIANDDCYIYSDDPTALGKNVAELEISDDYKKKVHDDYTGVVDFEYGGIDYTSIFTKSETTGWLAIATLPVSEVNATRNHLVMLMAVLAALILIILVVVIIAIVRKVMRPLTEVSGSMEAFAGGNLTVEIPVYGDDEIGRMADSARISVQTLKVMIGDLSRILGEISAGNLELSVEGEYVGDFQPIRHALMQIIESLNFTLGQIRISAEQVSSGSEQVSAGAQALAQGASEQAGTVEELASSIGDISDQIKINARNAVEVNQRAVSAGDEVEKSNQRMQELVKAMTEIRDSSREIEKIIKVIEDIAFQTNILSLNASVEAARAGDAGRGFSVVADEVRNLASKSSAASKNTSALIANSLRAVENGVKIADETAQSLQHVVKNVTDVTAMVNEISRASGEQAQSAEQVNSGIKQISNVVQVNSATAEESAAASEELSAQAMVLKELLGKFRIKE